MSNERGASNFVWRARGKRPAKSAVGLQYTSERMSGMASFFSVLGKKVGRYGSWVCKGVLCQ